MDQEAENAWNPGFREAYKELVQDNSVYRTERDIALERCADLEPWQPTPCALEWVPNFGDVEIEFITQETDLNSASRLMVEQGSVGIVLMGQNIGRFAVPSLVILTTKTKFYVIDGNDRSRGIEFLKYKLRDNRIEFYTSNGVQESDSLFHNYNIDLAKHENVNCCTGLNIILMRQIRFTTKPRQLSYPTLAREMSRRRNHRIESFESLVQCWLDIQPEDIMFRSNQIIHLQLRPLNLTAINMIKKRCLLVLPLAKELEFQCRRETIDMSREFYNMLPETNDRSRKAYEDIFKSSDNEKLKVLTALRHLAGTNWD